MFLLLTLVVLKWASAVVLAILGGVAIYDVLRTEPKIPDPMLALINLAGYLALIALALVIAL